MRPPLATRLSGLALWRGSAPVFRRLGALARRSQERLGVLCLLALTGAGSSGCLVAEAPEYGPPRKTTPVIEWQNVKPPPYEILRPAGANGRPSTTQPFTIRIRSEDAGDPVVVYGYVDYLTGAFPGPIFMEDWEFGPAPTSAPRDLPIEWSLRGDVTPECHQVTIFVTHKSNYSLSVNAGSNGGLDPNDIAAINWWATFDPNAAPGNNLEGCPSATTPP